MGSSISRRMRALRADGTDVHNNTVPRPDSQQVTGKSFLCPALHKTLFLPCTEPSTTSGAIESQADPVDDVDQERIASHETEDGISAAVDAVPSHASTPVRHVAQDATRLSCNNQPESPAAITCGERGNIRVQQHLVDRLKQMSGWGKFALLVTVSFSLIAVMRLMSSMTRESPEPPVFFKPTTGIVDFRRGEMTQLSLRVLEHEVSFVMYYAHWDLDSMNYRTSHADIAKVYGQEIFFAAINCWWPDGECSKVMRLKRFPVLLAHVRNVGDIEYRGPLVTSYIIPFLENILVPVIPVQNPGELLDLRSRHDVSHPDMMINYFILFLWQAVITRFFDFRDSVQPLGYNNYLALAVKSLAEDPWRKVQFTIVTSRKAAHKLRTTRSSSLYMFMWNASHEVTVDDDRNQNDNILRWIHDTVREKGSLVEWVTPSGMKSNLLNAVTSRDPTLILFTPRTSLFGISPYYEIVSLSSCCCKVRRD